MTDQPSQWALDRARKIIGCVNHERNDICYPDGVAGKGPPMYCSPHTKIAIGLDAAWLEGVKNMQQDAAFVAYCDQNTWDEIAKKILSLKTEHRWNVKKTSGGRVISRRRS